MKIALDPMPALRLAAAAKVNLHFNALAQSHRDAAHAMKRAAAEAGAPFPNWFSAEADLRDVTPEAFATLILSKPDALGARELERQRVLLTLDAAATPADLTRIVDKLLQS